MDNLIQKSLSNIAKTVQQRFGQATNTLLNTKFMPNQKMTVTQAVQKAIPNFATDFGNVLRGTGGIQGQQLKNPIIPKIPVISNLAKLSGNTGQSIASGMGDIGRGAYNVGSGIQQGNFLKIGQGLVNTGMGAAKIAAPTTPFFQAGNVLSQSGGNLTQRIGKGMIQGQTGITGLAPDVKEQQMNIMGMKIDPVVGAASLAGFVQNPAWAKIFGQTSKLAQYGLKGIALKGGVEGLIQGLDQLPDNPSQRDITNTLLTNIALGTGAEVGSQVVSNIFKKINGTKLAQSIKDDISKRFASDTVVTAQGHMPKWKAMMKNMLGEDIYTNQSMLGKAESSIELPKMETPVVTGKARIKVRMTPVEGGPQMQAPKMKTVETQRSNQLRDMVQSAYDNGKISLNEARLLLRTELPNLQGKVVYSMKKKQNIT